MCTMIEEEEFRAARERMVATQIASRGIQDQRVLDAFLTVPRHAFLPQELWQDAYEDHPLPIGYGQTISQPYIVALMTSQLNLIGHEKVLEIGTGSGYQAAILGRLAGEVHSIERIEDLAIAAENCLIKLKIKNVHVHVFDGSLGWAADAPYDDILVTAAAPQVPDELIAQLKMYGKLIVPIGARWRQMLEIWIKKPSRMVKKEILPVVFVPLKGEHGWQDSDWY